MTSPQKFEEIASKLAAAGAVEYQIEGPSTVRWRASDETIVAHASFKAIMSFASTNNSYRWGLMPEHETVPQLDGYDAYGSDVTEEQTREIATRAALADNADFMFAGTWVTLTVYLACRDVEFGADVPGEEASPWHPIHGDMSEHAQLVLSIIDALG